jgi:hypothetical protein
LHRDLRIWRLAGVALIGALALETVLILSDGLEDAFTVQRIPSHLVALVVGTLIGWMYELLRELNRATELSLQQFASMRTSIESLTSRIKYQDEALSMLTSCPRHNEVLTALIEASMRDNFRSIPYVGEADYLRFLTKAIDHSDGYEGVHRVPLSWFLKYPSYLDALRQRNMSYKTRIFIIDDDDVIQMERELADPQLLNYYWEHTGSVASFWISTTAFKRHCPGIRIPTDFGLYDRELLIAYDGDRQLLHFNTLAKNNPVKRIFSIQRELQGRNIQAFKEIPRTTDTATITILTEESVVSREEDFRIK